MTQHHGALASGGSSKQHLLIYAEEVQQLHGEVRRLRARLAENGQWRLSADDSVGPYVIREEIGQGAFASVFRAYNSKSQNDVALKVLHPYDDVDGSSFAKKHKQEFEATASLLHPNIVEVYAFGEEEGNRYIAMEFVTGGTLKQQIGKPRSLAQIVCYLSGISDALDHAHQHGIVHRDVKPSNVLLDEDNAILADFGIARILEADSHVTRTSWILGTPDYMSPEQVLGEPADHRSDIYSLGVILYEMLLGRLPVIGGNPFATLVAHVEQSVAPPSEVDPTLDPRIEQVLMKSLAKNPDERFQTAGELAQEFALACPA